MEMTGPDDGPDLGGDVLHCVDPPAVDRHIDDLYTGRLGLRDDPEVQFHWQRREAAQTFHGDSLQQRLFTGPGQPSGFPMSTAGFPIHDVLGPFGLGHPVHFCQQIRKNGHISLHREASAEFC